MVVTLRHNKIFLNADWLEILQGSSVLHVPSIATRFFRFNKRDLSGHELSKKGLTLEGHGKWVKWARTSMQKKIRRFYSVISLYFSHDSLHVLPMTRYTYGEPVKGKADIDVQLTNSYGGSLYYTIVDGNRRTSSHCDGESCNWDRTQRKNICRPNPRCPHINHQLMVGTAWDTVLYCMTPN